MERKTVEQYLALGFDLKMAEYFAAGKKTLTAVEAMDNYCLLLTFDNSEKRILDLSDTISDGTVFAFLKDYNNFKRVYVDSCHAVCWDKDPTVDSELVWDNKVDICPDTCYVDSAKI